MRRLNSYRVVLRRHDRERGAAALLVAVTMVAMVGFTAIAVDVGRLYWERAELQNGADLAALSIAQACAKSPSDPDCTASDAAATDVASRNALDAQSAADATVDTSIGRVQVDTAASEEGASANSVSLYFARIFGDAEAEVRARAVARWGPPRALGAKFPLAFASCEIDAAPTYDGTLSYYLSHGSEGKSQDTCHDNAANLELPSGFGWLVEDPADSCSTDTAIGVAEPAEPGNDFPGSCADRLAEWKATLQSGGEVIALLPVFNTVGDKAYVISAYAAISVRGWHFTKDPQGNDPRHYLPPDAQQVFDDGNYRNSNLGFVGRFIRYVFTDEDATPGGGTSPYGANIVKLTD